MLISAANFAGQGDTNNGSNYTGSTNDMQDVNSPLQDPSRTPGKSQKPYNCFRLGPVLFKTFVRRQPARLQGRVELAVTVNEQTLSGR